MGSPGLGYAGNGYDRDLVAVGISVLSQGSRGEVFGFACPPLLSEFGELCYPRCSAGLKHLKISIGDRAKEFKISCPDIVCHERSMLRRWSGG